MAEVEQITLEPNRRPPLLLAAAALAVAGGLGFLAYRTWFADGGSGETEPVTEPVERTTIRSTIVASGVAEAVGQVTLTTTASSWEERR